MGAEGLFCGALEPEIIEKPIKTKYELSYAFRRFLHSIAFLGCNITSDYGKICCIF
jgi:hypothetical protein